MISMLKTKIFSIGNNEKSNYMIINKNRDTFKWLSIVFQFDDDDKELVLKSDIKKFIDVREVFRVGKDKKRRNSNILDKECELIIFYGRDKIYLTYECPIKYRKEIFGRMEDISYWGKTRK